MLLNLEVKQPVLDAMDGLKMPKCHHCKLPDRLRMTNVMAIPKAGPGVKSANVPEAGR